MEDNSKHSHVCTFEELKQTMLQSQSRPKRKRRSRAKKKTVNTPPPPPALSSDGRPPPVAPGVVALPEAAMADTDTTGPYNEVHQGIILGDKSLAYDLELLRRLGVTHILNSAMGKRSNLINTSAETYKDLHVTFLGISASDIAKFNMSKYFTQAADFIHGALTSGGRVFVHCQKGLSRSATLVIAYLMLKQEMDVKKAVQTVLQERAVMPNDGFLKQLIRLNEELYCTENSPDTTPSVKEAKL